MIKLRVGEVPNLHKPAAQDSMLIVSLPHPTSPSTPQRRAPFWHEATAVVLILLGTVTPGLHTLEVLEFNEVESEECELLSLTGLVRSQRTCHADQSRSKTPVRRSRKARPATVPVEHDPIGHCFRNGLRAPLIC